MIKIHNNGVMYKDGELFPSADTASREKTIAYGILRAHSTGTGQKLRIRFDAMASHDITYVGIIQTARATGALERFPIPYVLTNCHNSLCAVGGTINEDDHKFGLSACVKYGGIFVPAHESVIHSYMRENHAGCGKMIIGSDSHTRYGALGTLAVGEGGPELVKQLVGMTYDIDAPQVIAVRLKGKPAPGVGPHDAAIALIGAVFKSGIVKNKILEFIGEGVHGLPIEFRNGIDVMTTETACLSSIWETDGKTEEYLAIHGRASDYRELKPGEGAYYDGAVELDLSKLEPMIAVPFHPSNAYTIREFNENAEDILRGVEIYAKENLGAEDFSISKKLKDGRLYVDQGVIAGCAGGIFDNLCAAADILDGKTTGNGEFSLSAYPASQPVFLQLIRNGAAAKLMSSGVTLRTAFCGPCFGAGDVPSNGSLSIRHSTRNFPNREGSKPGNGQFATVALMDARSIAATASNGGRLTAATELDVKYNEYRYVYDDTPYRNRVYYGFGKADPEAELKYGPGIADWPKIPPLTKDVLLEVAAYITDPVTTTDELIPSGETSSYRSNPYKLSEFTLSRKVPGYVGIAKSIREREERRRSGEDVFEDEYAFVAKALGYKPDVSETGIGSVVCSLCPGDGSAREQAASCQRVLGGLANICVDYATKRYRSNLINWGMLPFRYGTEKIPLLSAGDIIYVKGVARAVADGISDIEGIIIYKDGRTEKLPLKLPPLTDEERDIILSGCLINSCGKK